jgi:hypothetical protein
METVHCNFAKQHHDPGRPTKIIFIHRLPRPVPSTLNCFVDFHKVIGIVVVKSGPIYFHAQSTTRIKSDLSTTIPFNHMIQNMGNAMSSSGLFVAPKSGKYLFALLGISKWDSFARAEFQMRAGVTSNCIKITECY